MSDARRASETGLMRRREEYRGGGNGPAGPAGPRAQPGETAAQPNAGGEAGMNQAGDRIRFGMFRSTASHGSFFRSCARPVRPWAA